MIICDHCGDQARDQYTIAFGSGTYSPKVTGHLCTMCYKKLLDIVSKFFIKYSESNIVV